MIKALEHIGIMVNDIQKSVEFYTDVLGFSVSRKIEMTEAGLSVVFVEKNGSKIELMKCRDKNVPKRSDVAKLKLGGNSLPISDHISFSVDYIEDTVTELKGKG